MASIQLSQLMDILSRSPRGASPMDVLWRNMNPDGDWKRQDFIEYVSSFIDQIYSIKAQAEATPLDEPPRLITKGGFAMRLLEVPVRATSDIDLQLLPFESMADLDLPTKSAQLAFAARAMMNQLSSTLFAEGLLPGPTYVQYDIGQDKDKPMSLRDGSTIEVHTQPLKSSPLPSLSLVVKKEAIDGEILETSWKINVGVAFLSRRMGVVVQDHIVEIIFPGLTDPPVDPKTLAGETFHPLTLADQYWVNIKNRMIKDARRTIVYETLVRQMLSELGDFKQEMAMRNDISSDYAKIFANLERIVVMSRAGMIPLTFLAEIVKWLNNNIVNAAAYRLALDFVNGSFGDLSFASGDRDFMNNLGSLTTILRNNIEPKTYRAYEGDFEKWPLVKTVVVEMEKKYFEDMRTLAAEAAQAAQATLASARGPASGSAEEVVPELETLPPAEEAAENTTRTSSPTDSEEGNKELKEALAAIEQAEQEDQWFTVKGGKIKKSQRTFGIVESTTLIKPEEQEEHQEEQRKELEKDAVAQTEEFKASRPLSQKELKRLARAQAEKAAAATGEKALNEAYAAAEAERKANTLKKYAEADEIIRGFLGEGGAPPEIFYYDFREHLSVHNIAEEGKIPGPSVLHDAEDQIEKQHTVGEKKPAGLIFTRIKHDTDANHLSSRKENTMHVHENRLFNAAFSLILDAPKYILLKGYANRSQLSYSINLLYFQCVMLFSYLSNKDPQERNEEDLIALSALAERMFYADRTPTARIESVYKALLNDFIDLLDFIFRLCQKASNAMIYHEEFQAVVPYHKDYITALFKPLFDGIGPVSYGAKLSKDEISTGFAPPMHIPLITGLMEVFLRVNTQCLATQLRLYEFVRRQTIGEEGTPISPPILHNPQRPKIPDDMLERQVKYLEKLKIKRISVVLPAMRSFIESFPTLEGPVQRILERPDELLNYEIMLDISYPFWKPLPANVENRNVRIESRIAEYILIFIQLCLQQQEYVVVNDTEPWAMIYTNIEEALLEEKKKRDDLTRKRNRGELAEPLYGRLMTARDAIEAKIPGDVFKHFYPELIVGAGYVYSAKFDAIKPTSSIELGSIIAVYEKIVEEKKPLPSIIPRDRQEIIVKTRMRNPDGLIYHKPARYEELMKSFEGVLAAVQAQIDAESTAPASHLAGLLGPGPADAPPPATKGSKATKKKRKQTGGGKQKGRFSRTRGKRKTSKT